MDSSQGDKWTKENRHDFILSPLSCFKYKTQCQISLGKYIKKAELIEKKVLKTTKDQKARKKRRLITNLPWRQFCVRVNLQLNHKRKIVKDDNIVEREKFKGEEVSGYPWLLSSDIKVTQKWEWKKQKRKQVPASFPLSLKSYDACDDIIQDMRTFFFFFFNNIHFTGTLSHLQVKLFSSSYNLF